MMLDNFILGRKTYKSEIPLHSRSKGIIVKSYDFVDIDDMNDWNFAEILYKIKMKIALEVDSSNIIGSGHLIRSINLAKAFC